MALTEKGYVRRTYDDILNDKIQRAKELLGENIDTSDQSVLGKYIRINAYDQALMEEEAEKIYYSRFPNTASGQSLDRLMVFAALRRNTATAAMYSVDVQGTAGYVIPMEFLVGTDTELTFSPVQEYTIGEDGTCRIVVSCTEAGTIGNVDASAINKVVNPDANISAVAGAECLSAGIDEESDKDLRTRFNAAVAGSGSCNANAIRAALLRIPTVQFAAVIENDESTEDSEGRPPNSFECYVLGGDDYEQEIAEAIFEKRPIGVKTVGEKTVTITDASGNEKAVRYSPAPRVAITVRLKIQASASFPTEGVAAVQSNVANYINTLGIGKSLVLTSLYGPVHSVPGVVDVPTLELSADGGASYSTANVSVPKYGVAVCAAVNVEVIA